MSGSDHAPRAGRIKLEMKIRRGKAAGVEGSGRGSTTYQAAAAAFVYDDHHGDVRVRRVIVVGLALVASLGFGQAEKRAHEPTHVAAGLATSTKFREKNRELLPGCSFAWTRTSESRLSSRLSALVWYWRVRERLFRASNRARSRVRRLMEQTPEVLFLELRRAGIFGASQNLHDLRASGFSKPQIYPLLWVDSAVLWSGCFSLIHSYLSYEQTCINAIGPENRTRFNEIGTDSIVRARSA